MLHVPGVNGEWHEQVWGVDLILAELSISAGRDPAPFLKKSRNPKKALAQLWVTTNQDKDSDDGTGTIGELVGTGVSSCDKMQYRSTNCGCVAKMIRITLF
jgi:hypothetical protein